MSVLTIGVFSLIVDGLSFLPCLSHDKIVAVVCGGIIYGTSAYFSVRAQISTGGTDLLAKLLITKFKTVSVGQMLMILDGTIVVLAMIAYRNFGHRCGGRCHRPAEQRLQQGQYVLHLL